MLMLRTLTLVVFLAMLVFVLLAMVYSPARNTPGAWSLAAAPASPGVDSSRQSAAAPVGSSSSILGRPSLSVAFINRVLSAYHSPAAGLGSVLYQDSLNSGIDDAYALAFFLHESGMGNNGVARTTHSLGNIRCTPGWSCVEGYRYYISWAAGFLDWFRLMVSEYLPRHLTTPASILPVYAPPSDNNNDDAYIASVCAAVSTWRTGQVVV